MRTGIVLWSVTEHTLSVATSYISLFQKITYKMQYKLYSTLERQYLILHSCNILHFITDYKQSCLFSNGFLENTKYHQNVSKVINLLWNQKLQGTGAGEVALPCWQFLDIVPSHQQLFISSCELGTSLLCQSSCVPFLWSRKPKCLWSTEISDCLCSRAHESSELEPGTWRLPAPAEKLGDF